MSQREKHILKKMNLHFRTESDHISTFKQLAINLAVATRKPLDAIARSAMASSH